MKQSHLKQGFLLKIINYLKIFYYDFSPNNSLNKIIVPLLSDRLSSPMLSFCLSKMEKEYNKIGLCIQFNLVIKIDPNLNINVDYFSHEPKTRIESRFEFNPTASHYTRNLKDKVSSIITSINNGEPYDIENFFVILYKLLETYFDSSDPESCTIYTQEYCKNIKVIRNLFNHYKLSDAVSFFISIIDEDPVAQLNAIIEDTVISINKILRKMGLDLLSDNAIKIQFKKDLVKSLSSGFFLTNKFKDLKKIKEALDRNNIPQSLIEKDEYEDLEKGLPNFKDKIKEIKDLVFKMPINSPEDLEYFLKMIKSAESYEKGAQDTHITLSIWFHSEGDPLFLCV